MLYFNRQFIGQKVFNLKWFEVAGLIILFLSAILEVCSIQRIDYQRSAYEQNVEFQILQDLISYQFDIQGVNAYLLQISGSKTLNDQINRNSNDFDKMVKALDRQLSIYSSIFKRLSELVETVANYREDVNLKESEQLSSSQTSLAQLKSFLKGLKKESHITDDIFKYPVTHMKELAIMTIDERETIRKVAQSTGAELEARRKRNAAIHLWLFVFGSIIIIVAKCLETASNKATAADAKSRAAE